MKNHIMKKYNQTFFFFFTKYHRFKKVLSEECILWTTKRLLIVFFKKKKRLCLVKKKFVIHFWHKPILKNDIMKKYNRRIIIFGNYWLGSFWDTLIIGVVYSIWKRWNKKQIWRDECFFIKPRWAGGWRQCGGATGGRQSCSGTSSTPVKSSSWYLHQIPLFFDFLVFGFFVINQIVVGSFLTGVQDEQKSTKKQKPENITITIPTTAAVPVPIPVSSPVPVSGPIPISVPVPAAENKESYSVTTTKQNLSSPSFRGDSWSPYNAPESRNKPTDINVSLQ